MAVDPALDWSLSGFRFTERISLDLPFLNAELCSVSDLKIDGGFCCWRVSLLLPVGHCSAAKCVAQLPEGICRFALFKTLFYPLAISVFSSRLWTQIGARTWAFLRVLFWTNLWAAAVCWVFCWQSVGGCWFCGLQGNCSLECVDFGCFPLQRRRENTVTCRLVKLDLWWCLPSGSPCCPRTEMESPWSDLYRFPVSTPFVALALFMAPRDLSVACFTCQEPECWRNVKWLPKYMVYSDEFSWISAYSFHWIAIDFNGFTRSLPQSAAA